MVYDIAVNNVNSQSLIDALFGKTKKAIIGILFSQPDRVMHLRELARRANVSPTAVAKEAKILADAGLIISITDGNRVTFRANQDSPIFEELRSIAKKTYGLVDILRQALINTQGIEQAFVFGSMANGTDKAHSDIDLMVIGNVDMLELYDILAPLDKELGRPIHVSHYDHEELNKVIDDKIVQRIFEGPKLMVIDNATN